MVDHKRWIKRIGSVAVFANIGGRDMNRALARGCRPVMAGYAIADNTDVVEYRWHPGIYSVAVVTLIV